MTNKNNLPIYLSLATILGIVIGVLFNGSGSSLSLTGTTSSEAKIKRLIDYIQRDYVDNVNTDELLDGAITQILGKLDPHSVYIPKESLQQVTENMQGNFVGIGIQFRMVKDTVTVIQTIKGGPSIRGGIKAGDRILIANEDTLYGKNLPSGKIPKFLKGKPDTEVSLTIYRKSNDSVFNTSINRGKVAIKSVDLAYMINGKLGYIKLNRFAKTTYNEFKAALDSLLNQGMKTLVLDLRGNGGGFIDIANKIADEFLEEDKLIVFTKNNKGRIDKSFATSKGAFEKGRLYVLIDESSASASEIVAGALQDNDKGTIIGRRSFGKGLVQVEMNLGDGSAVRLTTARYYTPTGRSIQKPYAKNGNYRQDYTNRLRNGELLYKDSIPFVDSLQYSTPKGKIVYGGGGIIPDVFIPIDTTTYLNNFYFRTINDFAFDYVDNNRNNIASKWPSIGRFVKEFDANRKVSDAYFSKVTDGEPSYKTKQTIRRYLKASIANELFSDVGFNRIIHQKDKMLQKVLELENTIE